MYLRALELASSQLSIRQYSKNVIQNFSLKASGKRYDSNLKEI
jgi:hypothetical protein